ncbi:MAG: ABC transporter ATP-binding protein [Candidatus Melainabacteria bacterium]|nr:MAG: ABC transporter ATP-binding protein [Candidatus Melainabacteria bacterium]
MTDKVIEVKNLSKAFGERTAVDGLSFDTRRGEILGLLGANGAGKTTSMHMLLGLTTPTSGLIQIFGKAMPAHRVEILQKMNFASAYQFLPYNLRVWENLYIFAEIYGVKNKRKKIDELLGIFELSHLSNHTTGRLSSGEQTRLNLCKALLNDPELLLLDEPTASLDPDIADKVRKALAQLHKETGMTIINTSHNMIDVHELCSRILFMQHGKIIAEGSADEILQKYGSETLEEVFITIARNPVSQKV